MSNQLESNASTAAPELGDSHGEIQTGATEECKKVVEEVTSKKEDEAISMQGLEDTVKGILHDIGVTDDKVEHLSEMKDTLVKGVTDSIEKVKSDLTGPSEQPQSDAAKHDEGAAAPKQKDESFSFASGIAGALKKRLSEVNDDYEPDDSQEVSKPKPKAEQVPKEEAPGKSLSGFASGFASAVSDGIDQITKVADEKIEHLKDTVQHKDEPKEEKVDEKKEDTKKEAGIGDLVSGLAGTLQGGFEHVKQAVDEKLSDVGKEQKQVEEESKPEKKSEEKPESPLEGLVSGIGGAIHEGVEHLKEKLKPEEVEKHETAEEAPAKKVEVTKPGSGLGDLVTGLAGAVQEGFDEVKDAIGSKMTEKSPVETPKEDVHKEVAHEDGKKGEKSEPTLGGMVSGIGEAIHEGVEHLKEKLSPEEVQKHEKHEIAEEAPAKKVEVTKPESGLGDLVTGLAGAVQEGFGQVKDAIDSKMTEKSPVETPKEDVHKEVVHEDGKKGEKSEPTLESMVSGIGGAIHEGVEHLKEKLKPEEVEKHETVGEAPAKKVEATKEGSGLSDFVTGLAGALQEGISQVKEVVDTKVDTVEEHKKDVEKQKPDVEVKQETEPQESLKDLITGIRGAVTEGVEHMKSAFDPKVKSKEDGVVEPPMIKKTVEEGVEVPTQVGPFESQTKDESGSGLKNVLENFGITDESIQKLTEIKDSFVKDVSEKVEDLKKDITGTGEEPKKGDDEKADEKDKKEPLAGIMESVNKGVQDLFSSGDSAKKDTEKAAQAAVDEVGETFEKVKTTSLTAAEEVKSRLPKMEQPEMQHLEKHEEVKQAAKPDESVSPPLPLHEAKIEERTGEEQIPREPIVHKFENQRSTSSPHVFPIISNQATDQETSQAIPIIFEDQPAASSQTSTLKGSTDEYPVINTERGPAQSIPIIFEDQPAASSQTSTLKGSTDEYPVINTERGPAQSIPIIFEDVPVKSGPKITKLVANGSDVIISDRGSAQSIPIIFEDQPAKSDPKITTVGANELISTSRGPAQTIPIVFEDESASNESKASAQVIPVQFVDDDAQVIPVVVESAPKRRKQKPIEPLHSRTMPMALTNPSKATEETGADEGEQSIEVVVESDTDDSESLSQCDYWSKRRFCKRKSSFDEFAPSAYLQQKMSMDIGVVNTANIPEQLIPLHEELKQLQYRYKTGHRRDSHDSHTTTTSNDSEMLIETTYFDERQEEEQTEDADEERVVQQIQVHFEDTPEGQGTMRPDKLIGLATAGGTVQSDHLENSPSQPSNSNETQHPTTLSSQQSLTPLAEQPQSAYGTDTFTATLIERRQHFTKKSSVPLHENSTKSSECWLRKVMKPNELGETDRDDSYVNEDEDNECKHSLLPELIPEEPDTPIPVIFEEHQQTSNGASIGGLVDDSETVLRAQKQIRDEWEEVPDSETQDVLDSVQVPAVREQVPSTIVESVPESLIKFDSAPPLHQNVTPSATEESNLQHGVDVLKTDIKSMVKEDTKHEEKPSEELKASETKPVEQVAKEVQKKEDASSPPSALPKAPPPPVPPKTKSVDMSTKEFEEKVLHTEPKDVQKVAVSKTTEPQHPAEPEKKPIEPVKAAVVHEHDKPSKIPKPTAVSPKAEKRRIESSAPVVTPKAESPKKPERPSKEEQRKELVKEDTFEKQEVSPLCTKTSATTTSHVTTVTTPIPSESEAKSSPPKAADESKKPSVTATTVQPPAPAKSTPSKVEEQESAHVPSARAPQPAQQLIAQQPEITVVDEKVSQTKTEPKQPQPGVKPVEKTAATEGTAAAESVDVAAEPKSAATTENVEEATDESGTMKAKSGESTNGQQQRKRCTIL